MPRLSHTYISHVLQQDLELRKIRQVDGVWWKTTSCYQAPALYISHTPFLHPSSRSWTIIFSPHILFTFSRRSMLQHIHPLFLRLSNSPPSPPTHQTLPPSLSLFLPGGEHNLISHCWMRRPLLSGSRWWKIRPFGLNSFCIHTALLAAREHQITLNLGSLTPLILNGRLI